MRAIIQTYSGKLIDLFRITPADICIEDIAAGLRASRFNAHTQFPYTIDQHSVLVSQFCLPSDAPWGLMHDAPEAYIGDMVGPLKNTPIGEGFRELETRIMAAICERYELPMVQPASVTEADMRMLATEKRDLLRHDVPWPHLSFLPYDDVRIRSLPPAVAMADFLNRFYQLWPNEPVSESIL